MVRLTLAKDVKTALRTADTAVVLATKHRFAERRFPRILTARLQRLAVDLARDIKPGLAGSAARTLTGALPERLGVGVLPDGGSRYTAPGRPDAIEKVVRASGLDSARRCALILIIEAPDHVPGALNAVARAFPEYSRKTDQITSGRIQVILINPDGSPIRPDAYAREVFKVSRQMAALVDRAPTDLNPESFGTTAEQMLESLGSVSIERIIGDELLEYGLGGIHAVGRAAVAAPRMIIATHVPTSASQTHVALVGKGVTFDTGGLHVKPRGAMETMKCDMGGAAAVLGAFMVLVKANTPHPVSLILCLAENAIGPASYKPDDVLDLHSGKTVEINNTDAEGRLLLADGASYAARALEVDVVIDAATLTGAQLVATGLQHAAVITNDAKLEALALEAGRKSGDLTHPLPFAPEFFKPEFKSEVADMKNSVKNRANAQSSCAGQFVYNHLEDTPVRWTHIDLAGPAFRGERGTGFGVALISRMVLDLENA